MHDHTIHCDHAHKQQHLLCSFNFHLHYTDHFAMPYHFYHPTDLALHLSPCMHLHLQLHVQTPAISRMHCDPAYKQQHLLIPSFITPALNWSPCSALPTDYPHTGMAMHLSYCMYLHAPLHIPTPATTPTPHLPYHTHHPSRPILHVYATLHRSLDPALHDTPLSHLHVPTMQNQSNKT